MIPTHPIDTTPQAYLADAALPSFLDDSYQIGPDDAPDWWLDMGTVALPGRGAV